MHVRLFRESLRSAAVHHNIQTVSRVANNTTVERVIAIPGDGQRVQGRGTWAALPTGLHRAGIQVSVRSALQPRHLGIICIDCQAGVTISIALQRYNHPMGCFVVCQLQVLNGVIVQAAPTAIQLLYHQSAAEIILPRQPHAAGAGGIPVRVRRPRYLTGPRQGTDIPLVSPRI